MEYLQIKNFGGYTRLPADNALSNQMIQCDNFWGMPDFSSASLAGMLSKSPAIGDWGDPKVGCTFTHGTDVINATANNLVDGMQLYLSNSGGALPVGLSSTTIYYVVNKTTDTFQISLSSGGAVKTFTDNGTGSHYFSILGRGRGIAQYLPTIGYTTGSYLLNFQCVLDYSVGKLYALDIDNNIWKELLMYSSSYYPYHMEMKQIGDKMYFAAPNVAGYGIQKWHKDFGTQLASVYDKANPTILATRTLTWAPGGDLDLVTADADISATLKVGMFIRKSSSSVYWDEIKSITNSGLNINLLKETSDSGASAAGGSQYTATKVDGPLRCLYIESWKGKLWTANNSYNNNRSTLYWSVTEDPDNWDSTLGAGEMLIDDDHGEEITGIASFDDYFFVFKDTKYFVYRWTGDLDEPIEFVRQYNYGNVTNIVNIGEGLAYFTGMEVRVTNGTSDSSLFYPAFSYAVRGNSTLLRSSNYYSLTVTDDSRPYLSYDKNLSCLFYNNAGNFEIYDFIEKKWTGRFNAEKYSASTFVESATATPVMINCKSSYYNKPRTFSRSALDYANSGVLFSSAIDFGVQNKKKKVSWVEFTFHPYSTTNCNTNIYFDWWDFDETKDTPAVVAAANPNCQVYNLKGLSSSYEQRYKKRFTIGSGGATCNKFGFVLWDENNTGTAGWGIIDITIGYNVMDSV